MAASALRTPRVNNNDDTVRLVKLLVGPGDSVAAGQTVAEVETDKATFTVESDRDGCVLRVEQSPGATIEVGSVLLWMGADANEPVPDGAPPPAQAKAPGSAQPTLKAAQLLARHNVAAADVPARGDRITVEDVEAFLASRREPPAAPAIGPGNARALTPEQRGMLRTVSWQRDEAVPAYVELSYDAAAWDRAAAEHQRREKLLLSPLLPLIAYKLARVAAANERLNATIIGNQFYVYDTVNLGFTVQSDTTLYLVVVRDAASLGCREFIQRLGRLQRSALANTVTAGDIMGATVSFSSMARWNVARHVPVLPPHTSLIVAHAAVLNGMGTLGATYDHCVLTGHDALSALQAIATPEELS
jgi:pyruvate/2-oxoglutarate dehydrogenase complex dihydrolipoamide acyltransferase (E2) component